MSSLRPFVVCAFFVVSVLFTTAAATSQVVNVLSPQPVAPGSSVTIQIVNATSESVCTTELHLIGIDGDARALPFAEVFLGVPMGPSGSVNVSFTAPVPKLPGGNSYLIEIDALASLNGSVTLGAPMRFYGRLDVGSPGFFPVLHAHPTRMTESWYGRLSESQPTAATGWDVINTSSVAHQPSPGDRIEVRAVGATTPLLVQLLNQAIPAHDRITVGLSLHLLPNGPYEVWTFLTDPVTFQQRAVPYGIRVWDGGYGPTISLRLPEGRRLPIGGALPISLEMSGFQGSMPTYMVLLGLTPGTTVGPNGVIVPVSMTDPLLAWSASPAAASVIGGQLGLGINLQPPWYYDGSSVSQPITLAHPGPAFSGLQVRVFAIAVNPNLKFGASQGELVTLL